MIIFKKLDEKILSTKVSELSERNWIVKSILSQIKHDNVYDLLGAWPHNSKRYLFKLLEIVPGQTKGTYYNTIKGQLKEFLL